jgi:hypothetical protein
MENNDNSFLRSNNLNGVSESVSGPSDTDLFSNKNILILFLTVILLFSFLGINILVSVGGFLEKMFDVFKPVVYNFLALLGYSTGTILNKSSDVVSDTAKVGIDILDGSVQNIGNLLKTAGTSPNFTTPQIPLPNDSSHPIQTGASSSNNKWCLVGEYQQKRGCIEIGDQDKCMSGQVFPNQKMCLNPTMTPNM